MKKVYLLIIVSICLFGYACRDDESYKRDKPVPIGNQKIELALTSRVGAVVGDELTQYIKALNLFLFRENEQGNYILFQSRVLNKEQLEALSESTEAAEAGFTLPKEITFDSVPLANYRIVGVGNALDSLGNNLSNVSLNGIAVGNTLQEVLVKVNEPDQPSRLFWGITEPIEAGENTSTLPLLRLSRKVAMFALTLEKIPNVVDKIDMNIDNIYGSFNMDGTYAPDGYDYIWASREYTQQVQDRIVLTYLTFPTIAGDSSLFTTTFYIADGNKQVVELPKYVLKPNTITKVTATIDTDQSGNRWKVNVNSLITVEVEWNVDQEPPITI